MEAVTPLAEVVLRFTVHTSNVEDLEQEVARRLDQFAPGASWRVGLEVDALEVRTGDGQVVSVSYEAAVTAILSKRAGQ